MANKFSKRKVMAAVKKSDGNMANIKRSLGLAQWGSANAWVCKWVDVKKLFTKLKNEAIAKKALAKKKPDKIQARNLGKHPGGTPPKFKEEFAEQAQALAGKGLNEKDIAEIFGVSPQTIGNWKKAYPQFLIAIDKGTEISLGNVKRSMYEKAVGYTHPDIHVSNFRGKITKTTVLKHYPPDTTAGAFILKNRDPENWKDKQEINGNLGIDINTPITVNIVGKVDKK